MTDTQFIQSRNDLLDLVIEIVKRIVKDTNTAKQLISELESLKR